ncbi:calcium-binding protein [Lutimaribacter marinistellae]|uniref:Calcium-binding protein n=1 Tax=Lutimaribacter marinistellae TaxID=1820329 RepID=A0ABV7TN52_9RHOB
MLPIYLLGLLGALAVYGVYELGVSDGEDNVSGSSSETEDDMDMTEDTDGEGSSPMDFIGNDTVEGDETDETIDTAEGDDDVLAAGGDDTVMAGEGDDIVAGGEGDDSLSGEEGIDLMLGNEGDDSMDGGADTDWVEANEGDDSVSGGDGNDIVIGSEGADTLDGGDGDDRLYSGDYLPRSLTLDELTATRASLQAGDPLTLPAGLSPEITGDEQADEVNGGAGDDVLFLAGLDQATGGEGADEFVLLGNGTEVVMINDYDDGEDALVYVYDAGEDEPVLDLTDNGDGTQTLTANGEPAAVVAAASVSLDNVMLVQRGTENAYQV